MEPVVDAPPSARTRPQQHDPSGAGSGGEVSLFRLHLLRAAYLIFAVGNAVTQWPALVRHDETWPLMEGVVSSMLTAMSLLALLGLRYPVQMLPLLLFESAWKLLWLSAVALPLWTSDQMDAATREVATACFWVVIVLVAVPWRYVWRHYAAQRGDRWRPSPR